MAKASLEIENLAHALSNNKKKFTEFIKDTLSGHASKHFTSLIFFPKY